MDWDRFFTNEGQNRPDWSGGPRKYPLGHCAACQVEAYEPRCFVCRRTMTVGRCPRGVEAPSYHGIPFRTHFGTVMTETYVG